jgi:hypothetical protein
LKQGQNLVVMLSLAYRIDPFAPRI